MRVFVKAITAAFWPKWACKRGWHVTDRITVYDRERVFCHVCAEIWEAGK